MNPWQMQMMQQQMMQQQMMQQQMMQQQQQFQMWQQQQQQQQMWQQFQQWLQQNQQQYQPQNQQMLFQQFQQWQKQQGPQEMLPRNKPDENMTIGSGQNIINVTMNASTGHKVVIAASADTTIEKLLKMYTQKIGLSSDVIGKDIMFLYNGAQLDTKSEQSIGSMFRNTAVITVYDLNGIIGA